MKPQFERSWYSRLFMWGLIGCGALAIVMTLYGVVRSIANLFGAGW